MFIRNLIAQKPITSIALFYLLASFVAGLWVPCIWNCVVLWHQHFPSKLTCYLLNKEIYIFFERIRLISIIACIPLFISTFRQINKSNNHFINRCFPPKNSSFYLFIIFTGLGLSLILFILSIQYFLANPRNSFHSISSFTVLKIVFGSFLVSVLEEFLFRKIILKITFQRHSKLFSIIITSLIFAYLHFRAYVKTSTNYSFASFSDGLNCTYLSISQIFSAIHWLKFSILFFLGTFLCQLVIRYRSLSPAIGFHFGIVSALLVGKKLLTEARPLNFVGSPSMFDSYLALTIIIMINLIFALLNNKKITPKRDYFF